MSSRIRPKKDRNKPRQDRPRARRTTPAELVAAAAGAGLPRAVGRDSGVVVIETRGGRIPPALPPGIELVEYDIVYEAMPGPEELNLSPADQERLHRAAQWAQEPDSAAAHVADFQSLAREFPNIPSLCNYLYTALRRAGRFEEADRVLDDTRARFPDYLFGMLSTIERCLHDRRPEEVPAILKGCYSLHKLYPDRRRYHVSEYLAFHGTLAWYFHQTGNDEVARAYFRIMEATEPDYPITQTIRLMIQAPSLRRIIRLMARELRW